jgi:hypothetical protein
VHGLGDEFTNSAAVECGFVMFAAKKSLSRDSRVNFSAFLRDCLAGKHRLKRNKRWKTLNRGNPTMLQPASSHRCINYYRVRAIASAALTFNYRASFGEPGGLTLCRRESWKKPAKRADQVLRRYSHQALTRFVLSVSGSSQVIAKINKLSRQRLGKGGKVFVKISRRKKQQPKCKLRYYAAAML